MIYLFGLEEKVSIIYDGSSLTEEEKQKATLVLDVLPKPEYREGFFPTYCIEPETKELYFVYKPKTTFQIKFEKLQQLVTDGKITIQEMQELLRE